MRLIDLDRIKPMDFPPTEMDGLDAARYLNALPTIDAVPVVRCEKCVLHGNCITEDTFVFAGIENPFCCAGKRKEGADND